MFRIRIDIVNGLDIDQFLQISESEAWVVVRHELPHGNPHFHAWVKSSVKENTLRQRFKRKFAFLKSTDYSIKKCDEERANEYIQYMFNTKHGNRWELIDVRNFDTKLLDDLKEAAQKISIEFSESSSKSKAITIWDISQEVENEFTQSFHVVNNLGEEIHNFYESEQRKIEVYTDIAIKILRKHRKAFDEFLIRKVISTAMSSSESGRKMMRQKMIRNFIPRD